MIWSKGGWNNRKGERNDFATYALFQYLQRILAENIRKMVESLMDITLQMKTFNFHIKTFAGHFLNRINTAISLINQMAATDINDVYRYFSIKYMHSKHFSIAVDTTLHYIDAFYFDMRTIVPYLNSVDNIEARKHRFQSAQDTAVNLFLSLEALGKLGPLWPGGDIHSHERCQSRYNLTMDTITRITEVLNHVLANCEQINQTVFNNNHTINTWSGILSEHSSQANARIAGVKRCINEYITVMERAREEIESTIKAMKETLQNDFVFSYDEILHSVTKDLETIESSIVCFEDLLAKYSRNETTKLGMYSAITQANRTQLEGALSSVLARIDTHALETLQTMMTTSTVNIRKWLSRSLRAFATLEPYFNVVGEIRRLSIWHYPVLSLDSPDILEYRLGLGFIVSLPPSKDKTVMHILENKEDDIFFRDILRYYANNLSVEMNDFKVQLSGAKKKTMAAFDSLLSDVQSFRRKSQIDKDFIL